MNALLTTYIWLKLSQQQTGVVDKLLLRAVVCISIHTGSRKVGLDFWGLNIPNIGTTHIEKFGWDVLWQRSCGTISWGHFVIGPPSVIVTPCYWHSKRYWDTLLLALQALWGHLVIDTPNIIGAPCYWHLKRYWGTLLLAPQTLMKHLVIGNPNVVGTPCYWHPKLTPQTC